jgi:hypothetical protein
MVKPPEVYRKNETRKCTGAVYVATAFFTSWGPKKSIYILAKHQLMQIQTNQLTNQPSIHPPHGKKPKSLQKCKKILVYTHEGGEMERASEKQCRK